MKNVLKKSLKVISQDKLLTSIIILALFVRFLGLYPNFLNHPDEPGIQVYAQKVFLNIVRSGNFDPESYKYGTLSFYLNALVYIPITLASYILDSLGSLIAPSVAHKILPFKEYVLNLGFEKYGSLILWSQRAITALLGTFSVILIYLISKKLFGKPVGYLAAIFLALAPLHVRDSHYVTTDVPSLFFVLLALFFMTDIYKSGKWNSYILSGLFIGISTTVRYFPVALLAYPFACFLDQNKTKKWLLKIIIGSVFVLIGIFIGLPFLFLNPNDKLLFQKDLEKFVLPWYSTSLSAYAVSLMGYLVSFGKQTLPSLSELIPTRYFPFFSSYIFFNAFGIIPSILAVVGTALMLFKYPKLFLFVMIIPLFTFIYITSFLHLAYTRLAIPLIPFLAICAGITLTTLFNLIKRNAPHSVYILISIAILSLSLYYPLTQSVSSSFACNQKTVYQEARDWIAGNIPANSKIAVKTYIAFPSIDYTVSEIKPDGNFSLEEVRDLGYDYAFINVGVLDGYYLYPFSQIYFVPPERLYQNAFVKLALKEYQTRSNFLKQVTKPKMCDDTAITFYKIFPGSSPAKHVIKTFAFDNASDLKSWAFDNYEAKLSKAEALFNKNEGQKQKGSAEIIWQSISFTGPRLVSPKIPIQIGKIYTFSGWIKTNQALNPNERDGFLRMDFYRQNDDVLLPGRVIALSKRTYGEPNWRFFSITQKAPNGSSFLTLSLQVNGSKQSGSFYFDDLKLAD